MILFIRLCYVSAYVILGSSLEKKNLFETIKLLLRASDHRVLNSSSVKPHIQNAAFSNS